MTLYPKGYQNHNKSELKVRFLLSKYRFFNFFLITLEVEGHTVPYLKALISCKYELRELSNGGTFDNCQGILKIENLLHRALSKLNCYAL